MKLWRRRSSVFDMAFVVSALLVLSCILLFPKHAWANSPIPETKVIVDVENGPEEYYLTFLFRNVREDERENSSLHLDDVNWERVNVYFSEFYYDGWQIGSPRVKDTSMQWEHPVFARSEDDSYSFKDYSINGLFRILLVASDGSVRLSDPLKLVDRKANYWTYDYEKGMFKETSLPKGRALKEAWPELLLNYIVTLLMELLMLWSFRGYSKVKKNYLLVFCVNTCTNIGMNVFITIYGMELWLLLITEMIVVAVEAAVYSFLLKDREGKTSVDDSVVFSIMANLASFLLGGFVYFMFRILAIH